MRRDCVERVKERHNNREAAHFDTADQHRLPCADTNCKDLARLSKAPGLVVGAYVSSVSFCLVLLGNARFARRWREEWLAPARRDGQCKGGCEESEGRGGGGC